MQIYLARNNVQAGPYSLEQVNAMLSAGQVEFSDLMWHAGMQNWQTVGELTQNNRYYNPPIVNNTSPQVNLDKNPSDTPASPIRALCLTKAISQNGYKHVPMAKIWVKTLHTLKNSLSLPRSAVAFLPSYSTLVCLSWQSCHCILA